MERVTVLQKVEIINASDVAVSEHNSMKTKKMKNLPASAWNPTRKYTMQEKSSGKTVCTSISAIIFAT